MTALLVVEGLVACFVLAWMMYLLVRAPHNVPLRAVTVTIASFVLMFVVRSSVADGSGFLGLEPIIARLVLHFTNILGGYGLIVFFLFSALDLRTARRRAMWQAVPVVVVAGIMTWAVAAMPARVRDSAAALTTGRPGSPHAEITVALLYLTMYLYMLYAFSTALVWTWRYGRGAEPRLRRGLALASVGLAAIVPAEAVFSLSAVVRWTGGTLPRDLVVVAIPLFLGGVVVFLIGFAYPAVVMRLAAIRVWWQHRYTYHRLGPLWTLLHQEFPQDALNRVPTGQWRDRLRLPEIHRRYYRRVIECRDGLVRISPYMNGSSDLPLVDRLRHGLSAHASGATVGARATPVAIPRADGLDADVRELVALSDALQASK
ncbi:MAG TPA: MAB_1171c family putative transporter [Actinophytocola sp.]|uniref:MAB_1171c family putative transporter n=1 Tax=Actinophytocola sp. TaxID=1872138 RepID=UPI002E09201B|nr:MAB_1171c family putative transporter [Actinophytocola sp.]